MSATTSSPKWNAWWAEWGRLGSPLLDARSVPCPSCGAVTGYCKRPSGHKAMSAHASRWVAALRAIGGRV